MWVRKLSKKGKNKVSVLHNYCDPFQLTQQHIVS